MSFPCTRIASIREQAPVRAKLVGATPQRGARLSGWRQVSRMGGGESTAEFRVDGSTKTKFIRKLLMKIKIATVTAIVVFLMSNFGNQSAHAYEAEGSHTFTLNPITGTIVFEYNHFQFAVYSTLTYNGEVIFTIGPCSGSGVRTIQYTPVAGVTQFREDASATLPDGFSGMWSNHSYTPILDTPEATEAHDPCKPCEWRGESVHFSQSADPIFYATGEIDYYVDDLSTSGFKPLSIRRSYSQKRLGGAAAFGSDWISDIGPQVIRRKLPYVEVRLSAQTSLIFTEVNNAGVITYTPLRYNLEQLQVSGSDLLLIDQAGNRILFYGLGAPVAENLRGKVRQSIDEAGNASAYEHDGNGRVASITRVGGGAQESLNFTYALNDAISSVNRTIIRSGAAPVVVRSVTYSYYTGAAGEFGNNGQLQLVEVRNSSGDVLSRYHYRYWRTGQTQPGVGSAAVPGKLKFVISTGAWDRMVQAGHDPLTATDAVMADYAEKYWEYDIFWRVVRQTLRSHEVDGTGTQTFDYVTSANADAYNNWKTKTTETLPDGTQNIVYCNYAAQVLVRVVREAIAPNRQWVDAFRYDNLGREIWHATPAAITGYSATAVESDPYLGFGTTGNTSSYVLANDGLIMERAYYNATTATATTAGGSVGRLWKEMSRKGKNGTQEILRELKYFTRTGN